MKTQKSHGSTHDYKFGQKNNWRRWLWNQVFGRTNGREKLEIVLYLSGPQDLDRQVVGDRVPSRNMIAIDRCENNVAAVRSSGNYAVQADALEVLRAWPARSSVCAVVLDLCSGLWDREHLDKLSTLMMCHPALNNAVLAVNMLRGRDPQANEIIDLVIEKAAHIRWEEIQSEFGAMVGPKHRGYILATVHALVATSLTGGGHKQVWSRFKLFAPSFSTYRSGVQTFDSVVLDPFAHNFEVNNADAARMFWDGLQTIYEKDLATSRRIAATLATRTRQATA